LLGDRNNETVEQTRGENSMNPAEINCAEACVNGCVLGDRCPNQEYTTQASKFIQETSLDDLLAIAETAVRKRMMERASEPTQWVIPEE
jgi:hypothetical protein